MWPCMTTYKGDSRWMDIIHPTKWNIFCSLGLTNISVAGPEAESWAFTNEALTFCQGTIICVTRSKPKISMGNGSASCTTGCLRQTVNLTIVSPLCLIPKKCINHGRRKLRNQISDFWTDAAQWWEQLENKAREKVEHSRNIVFVSMCCGLWLWKVEK